MKFLAATLLSLFVTSTYAHINTDLYSLKMPEISVFKKETLNIENEVFSTEDLYRPLISHYLKNTLSKLSEDAFYIESKCNLSLETVALQKAFKTCFEAEKSNLKSDLYKTSTALSIAFLSIPVQREEIKKDFVYSFEHELKNIDNTYPHSADLRGYLGGIVVELYGKILKESYGKNEFIAEDNNIDKKEVETYFMSIAKSLDQRI